MLFLRTRRWALARPGKKEKKTTLPAAHLPQPHCLPEAASRRPSQQEEVLLAASSRKAKTGRSRRSQYRKRTSCAKQSPNQSSSPRFPHQLRHQLLPPQAIGVQLWKHLIMMPTDASHNNLISHLHRHLIKTKSVRFRCHTSQHIPPLHL
jgi:hypothetical protein